MIRITEKTGGVSMAVKVVPNASKDRLRGELDGALKVSVSAAPEAGAANKAVCRLLAKSLGVRIQAVSIESGQTSPQKTVFIAGLQADDVRRELNIQ